MRRVFLLVLVVAGCGAPDNSGKKAQPPEQPFIPPTHAASVRGFERPVAAAYDSAADVFFVSNLGADSGRARGAFISRVRPDGTIDSLRFIDSGRGGARLDAPQGLALLGDTLWVADGDVVRAFDARTGAAGPSISLAGRPPISLGGLAVGPDSALYAADPGPLDPAHPTISTPGGNRVFRIGRDHAVSVAVAGDSLSRPTDLAWDRRGKRFLIVSFGSGNIMAWQPGQAQPRTVGYNRAEMDGAAVLPDGRLLVTSWKDSSLTIRDGDRLTAITGFPLAAHIAVDTRRRRVAVPLPTRNRVDIWAIPPAAP